jgi:ABC-type multidrug transport system fused ATPase/permease subunit
MVSNRRIKDLLVAEEINAESIDRGMNDEKSGLSVRIENADFSWDTNDKTMPPTLRDINLQVQTGQLIAVVGRVGTGKSSLLSALLGEMEKLRGTASVIGKIGYVQQQAWVQNATLRENVVFGREFNGELYKTVIEACALEADLEVLPHGDETEIGEKVGP